MTQTDYVKQAKEILSSNGNCPKNTPCCTCIVKYKSVNACSPSIAIKVAQEYLDFLNSEEYEKIQDILKNIREH